VALPREPFRHHALSRRTNATLFAIGRERGRCALYIVQPIGRAPLKRRHIGHKAHAIRLPVALRFEKHRPRYQASSPASDPVPKTK
jgi:hypothetical protein